MGAQEVTKNTWRVLDYLESWHSIEASLMGSEEPYDHKAKGSSRPPVSDAALDLIEANREASHVLEPLLEELKMTRASYSGISAAWILMHTRHNPSAIPNWRANDSTEWKAVMAICHLLAQAVAAKMDGPDGPYLLRVYTSRKAVEEALGDPRGATNGKVRTYTAHYSYRIIDAEIERLMDEGYSEMAARQYLKDRGVSGPRISRARAFVREERGAA